MALLITGMALIAAAVALVAKDRAQVYKMRRYVENATEEKQVLMDFLHIATEDIAKGADKQTICRRLVRATAFSCGAISARLYEKSGGKISPAVSEGLFPPLLRRVGAQPEGVSRSAFLESAGASEALPAKNNVIADVLRTGEAVFIRNAVGDSRMPQHEDDALQIKTFMAVPVKMQDTVYGVLVVVNSITGKKFSQTIFSLAKSLGEQGGLALYNLEGMRARLAKSKMESDLRLARSVQNYLLPQSLPRNDAFSIAVKYIPHQIIGGDFYDILNLPGGKTGIVIADASGKGVSAAILMAVAQSKLHSLAKEGLSPAQTLIRLNAEIVHSIRTDMFVTITFAIIEKDASKVTLARAGHELPVIYQKAQNKCVEIRSSGMAVGLVDADLFDESIADVSLPLESGDILVLYTDGLTEAVNENGDEYTAKRLVEKIPQIAHQQTESFADNLIGSLNRFLGGNSYSDDLTLVAVKKI